MVRSAPKIKTQTEALEWRRERGRVVFTNGVFDVLHPGHVALLEAARAAGDSLIVALNDDASAARLGKGIGRPLNRLADRMRVIAAIGAVDCVTSFAEDTPATLIELILPDVLVKGGDYRGREIPGAAAVTSRGGSVIVVDYLDGHSTTRMLERIREAI